MQEEIQNKIVDQAKAAKAASFEIKKISTEEKNQALQNIASSIEKNIDLILSANKKDIDEWQDKVSTAFLKRLILNQEKIKALAESVRAVATLPDPVGEVVKTIKRPNGLGISKTRVPLGVLCCIFESRPNVVVDIAALSLKSGNACILRGGKEAINTNTALAEIIKEAIRESGLNNDCVQFVEILDREVVPILAQLNNYIDLIIPRGGEGLIDAVTKNATVPVLHHRKGITHIFVDDTAKVDMAVDIVVNAKTSNPSACNSLEKVLIHENQAEVVLPDLVRALEEKGVEVRGCEKTKAIVNEVLSATEEDWSTEYLDLIISIKVVKNIDEALAHINKYSTGLTDGIVTEDRERAKKFVTTVESAATYVNASTRFTDGSEFGLGAEVGISTSKLHGMGPMGLEELTTTRYIVFGSGQVR